MSKLKFILVINLNKMKKQGKNYLKFFKREVATLNRVREDPHENIMNVSCIFKYRHHVYIITDVSSCDLLEYITQKGLQTTDWSVHIYRQIIEGLNYLHNNLGIAHRDLKCENVLLDHSFEKAQICDLGFATFVPDNENLSSTFCGSISYSAPEIIRCEPYDPKLSDIWSVGILLFCIITGVVPFSTKHLRAISAMKCKVSIRTPGNVTVHEQLKKILYNLLRYEPKERPTLKVVRKFISKKNHF